MPAFKRTLLLSITLISIVAVVIHLTASSKSNSHVVGLTYRTFNFPCENASGSCFRPDPQGTVAEFILPNSLWADDRKDRYNIKVHLNLFANLDMASPISHDTSSKDQKYKNYLRGHDRTVAMYAWREDESFEEFLRERGLRLASPHGLDYLEYKDISNDYSVFDAVQCVSLTAEQFPMGGDSLKQDHPCLVSQVVKVPQSYEWAFASCLRESKAKHARANFSGCTINSRIAPGLYIEYTTDVKNIDNNNWIEVDRRIREYILTLRLNK